MITTTLCLLAIVCLLINFSNSLDPDQARQNIEPDMNPNMKLFDTLTSFLKGLYMSFLKELLENNNVEWRSAVDKNHEKNFHHAKSKQ